jgi:hypothetical protein
MPVSHMLSPSALWRVYLYCLRACQLHRLGGPVSPIDSLLTTVRNLHTSSTFYQIIPYLSLLLYSLSIILCLLFCISVCFHCHLLLYLSLISFSPIFFSHSFLLSLPPSLPSPTVPADSPQVLFHLPQVQFSTL